MSAQAQLLNPSARGARRFEHYPRGLHGPYVASPWAAARLGKRIFASRAEYHLWVRADYAPTGHHHPAAIAARIAEREARVALENAARWRQAVWDGVDPEAPMYVQPRVEIRKRQARANLRGGTGKGIRRCVRTQEEEAILVADIWGYMYPRQPECMYPPQPDYMYLPQEQEVYVPHEEAYVPQEDVSVVDCAVPLGESKSISIEGAVKLGESESVTILWWKPGREEEPRIKLEESESVTILSWTPGEEEKPRIKEEEVLKVLFPAESVYDDQFTVSTLLVPKEEEVVLADALSTRAAPVAIKLEASPSIQTVAIKLEASPSVQIRQEPVEDDLSFGHHDAHPASLHDVVLHTSGLADVDIEMVDEPLDAPKVEPVEGVLPLPAAPLSHSADDVEMAESCSTMDIVEEGIAMSDFCEGEQVATVLEVKEEDLDDDIVCLDSFSHLANDVPPVMIRAESPDDALLLAGAFETDAPPASAFEVKEEDVDIDIEYLDEHSVYMNDVPPVVIRAETPDDALILAQAYSMDASPVIDNTVPVLAIKAEPSEVDLPAHATPAPIAVKEFIKEELVNAVLQSADDTAAISMDSRTIPVLAEDIVVAETPRARRVVRRSRRRGKRVAIKVEPVACALQDLPVKDECVDVSVPEVDCRNSERASQAPEVDFKESLSQVQEVEFKDSPSQAWEIAFEECPFRMLEVASTECPFQVLDFEWKESTSVPEIDFEVAYSLSESDSVDSFYTASESFSYMSASLSVDTLTAQSPSLLAVLEEFACSPPLAPSTFDGVDLWVPSTAPSSTGLTTYPTVDNLAINIVSSPEFASNFAQAQFPSLVFRSFTDIVDDEGYYAGASVQDEDFQPLSGLQCATPYETACDFFDSPFDLVLTDKLNFVSESEASSEDEDDVASVSFERDKDTCNRQITSSTEPPKSPKEPFEELWHIAKAQADTARSLEPQLPKIIAPSLLRPQREPFEALWESARARDFTERALQPRPDSRASGQLAEVNVSRALADVDPFQSLYEKIDDLLELWAPEEPELSGRFEELELSERLEEPELTSVLPLACSAKGAVLSKEDEEYYRTPAMISLTGAGPHPGERLAKAARETFWQMWTRPSGEDLALLFKRSDDAPSGLHIFVEEDTRCVLLGTPEVGCSSQPLGLPLGAREQLKLEQRDSFLALWKTSLEQADL